ncbi:DASH complex subunit Ask1-domain-containing protein [Hypomontagnella monticulosa]|nr:DASH complex subunit Ask1-domain-containing protein [Hypomontagnella monticulosa]
MSRPGPSTGRTLTLTEELERLEQSITLTLQEIDHNFSKAHRIVTTSILPLVEQYGEHSKAVWEASQFWKQFFEASANVSLSGYEELAGDDETTTAEETTVDETTSDYNTTAEADDTTAEQSGYAEHHDHHDMPDDSLLDNAEITGSTPRPPTTTTKLLSHTKKPQFANFESPYEKLRRELDGDDTIYKDDTQLVDNDDDTLELPTHSTRTISQTRLPDMSMTPHSSSLLEEQVPNSMNRKHKDPLLHRILDKNYRLQATPHKNINVPKLPHPHRGRSPAKTGEAEEDRTRRALWADSPTSSPEMAVPKLRSDLYMPVGRGRLGAGAGVSGTPRTPGVSVQTPATARKTRDVFAEGKGKGLDLGKGKSKRDPDEITWESDEEDDEFGAFSPPKTIQFALPPSKLMQTPAREASKRIVDDILITAGANPEDSSEYSPTMVKMNNDILDDTF